MTIIYFIRHGEKPKKGENLSEKGKKREKFLGDHVFNGERKDIQKVTRILTVKPKKNKQKRPLETVEYLAVQLKIDIELFERGKKSEKFSSTNEWDNSINEQDIMKELKNIMTIESKEVVLVCWEHHILYEMLKILGINWENFNLNKWTSEDFDSIYEWNSQSKKSWSKIFQEFIK